MKHICLAGALAMLAVPAAATTIRDACLTSPRGANPRLCTCIQAAADKTLTRSDQKLAAKFFADPDRAQKVRMSNRRRHEVFWERYEAFGAFAASICD